MTTIQNIVFDFGGVLLDWNPRYLYRSYFNDDERMEHFLATVCTPEWNLTLDKGRPFAEAVAELQAKHPDYAEAIQMYWTEWPRMVSGELAETVQLLGELKAKGYAIYGLTNWSAETIKLMIPKFDFFRQLEGMVVSGEEKLLKPDAAIYHILLDRYHLKADETVFIDDSLPNVQGAEAVGIHGVHFTTAEDARKQLAALGV